MVDWLTTELKEKSLPHVFREKESVGPSVLWGPGWTSLHQATELRASESGQEGKGQSLQVEDSMAHRIHR